MSHSTSRPLPPELEVVVFNHLSIDKPALASCSLVCLRWLLHSRRHLFRTNTLKPKPSNPNRLLDFLQVVNNSRKFNLEWVPIGPCITKMTLDGRFWKLHTSLTCSLSLLYAILSALPQLTSLHLPALLLSDKPSHEFTLGDNLRFNIDEFVIVGCCKGDNDDPYLLFALLSKFSTIHSLAIVGWYLWRRHALPTLSLDAFAPPTVRSLTLVDNSPVVARALYNLLAVSPSVTDRKLTHINIFPDEPEGFGVFSAFAKIHGQALRKVELHAWVLPPTGLHSASMNTCTALRSLALCIFCEGAEDIRAMLRAYTQFFHDHRDAFLHLASVRIEMQLTSRGVLDAFERVSRDMCWEWPQFATMKSISSEEAEQNKQAWTLLEGALSSLRALECVEFVLYEGGDEFREDTKVELRRALESRLPML